MTNSSTWDDATRHHSTSQSDPPRSALPPGYDRYATVRLVYKQLAAAGLTPTSGSERDAFQLHRAFCRADWVHPGEWPPAATICVRVWYYPNLQGRPAAADTEAAWLAGMLRVEEHLQSLGHLTERFAGSSAGLSQDLRWLSVHRIDGTNSLGHWIP